MPSAIKDLLNRCETMDFGKITLSQRERNFYRRFNQGMVSFCRSLPASTQTDSIHFLMQYAGIPPGGELDFFARYYPPTWSILYWLSRDRTLWTRRLKKRDVSKAITAQTLAMFLHSLDDHLSDKQLSVSPLTLLLRSQAWTIMNQAFADLAEGLPGGKRTVRGFLDDYYSSLQDSREPKSLTSYGRLFKKQMAIGLVAPILFSMKLAGTSDFIRDLETAYGSFGIAWRLLDDIQDIRGDMEQRTHSAVYLCLSEKVKTLWNQPPRSSRAGARDGTKAILGHILEYRLIDKIKENIGAELEKAASRVEVHNLSGLAHEFRCLADPVKNR